MTKSKNKTSRREVRFPGIQRHSEALKVSREHLWQVLTGRRTSKRLLQRYRELLAANQEPLPKILQRRAA